MKGYGLKVFGSKVSINSLLNSTVRIFESKYSRVDQVKFEEYNLKGYDPKVFGS